MKRIALVLAALTFAASTALAYVQPGQLPRTQTPATKGPVYTPGDGQGTIPVPGNIDGRPGRRGGRPPVGGATNPVPEPGTMMLASMGLIALGAAVRRRRH